MAGGLADSEILDAVRKNSKMFTHRIYSSVNSFATNFEMLLQRFPLQSRIGHSARPKKLSISEAPSRIFFAEIINEK